MSAIKQINNVVPGIKRPMRLSDLQNVWNALNVLFDSPSNSFSVVAGLTYDTDDGLLSEGVVMFNHQLYWYGGNQDYQPGIDLYGIKIDGSFRTFGNGVEYLFDFDYIITDDPAGDGALESVKILNAANNNEAFLNAHRITIDMAGSVVTKKLADSAVTTPKIANGAVTSEKIANGSIGYNQLTTNLANFYVSGSEIISIPGRTTTLNLRQFMEGATPSTRGMNVLKLTKSEKPQKGYFLDLTITTAEVANIAQYPNELTLLVVPPRFWDVRLSVQTDSGASLRINYNQEFPTIVAGDVEIDRIIVLNLHKVTTTSYVVVNAYQTYDFTA